MSPIITSRQFIRNEYPIATGTKIFYYICFAAVICILSGLSATVFPDRSDKVPLYYTLPFSFLVIVACIYMIVRVYKEKLVITDNEILHIKARSTQILAFESVKGFQVDDKNIYIMSLTRDVKNITITKQLARRSTLLRELSELFTDLDAQQYENETAEILENTDYGANQQDREHNLHRAKLICNWVNYPAYVLFGVLLFYPEPYKLVMTIGMCYPLIALMALRINKLIRFDEVKNSAYPGIASGFIMSFIGLGLRLLFDLNIVSFQSMLIKSSAVFACIAVFLLTGKSQFKFDSLKNAATAALFFLFVYFYAYTACTALNCIYDDSDPAIYNVKVLGKDVTHGKHTSYKLKLEKWGSQTEPEEEDVGEELYDRTPVGGAVTIEYRKGLLDAPWYLIEK